MSRPTDAILLMAYGTPRGDDEVEPYFTHIRGGRVPSPESVENLRERYRRVGGRTPLLEITNAVAAALSEEAGLPVHVGMKHWHPFIADAVAAITAAGAERIIAIPLAPHYSEISIGGYRRAVEQALAEQGAGARLDLVEWWHDVPAFRELMAKRVRKALGEFSPASQESVLVLFTAHSLPERIRAAGDPYESQLLESAAGVAGLAGLDHWEFAFQSAGHTGEPWLGPDILEVLPRLAAAGRRGVLVVPIGFVADHLEILYDIDQEAVGAARDLGLELRRTPSLNADSAFIQVLAGIVADRRVPAGT